MNLQNIAFHPVGTTTDHPQPVSDQAYDGIVDLILSHGLRPGERTSVNILAERLGLGRMPVKEAVNRLQSEGILSVKGRSGTTVTSIDPSDIPKMFALRALLEDHAAEEAAANVTDEEIAHIDELVALLGETSVSARNRAAADPRFIRANVALHGAVVAASHNRFLYRAYATLQLQFLIVAYLAERRQDLEAAKQRQHEHEAIAAALRARDGKKLKHALKTHREATESVPND